MSMYWKNTMHCSSTDRRNTESRSCKANSRDDVRYLGEKNELAEESSLFEHKHARHAAS